MSTSPEPLDVWLYGRKIAKLDRLKGKTWLQLRYTDEALDTFPEGRRILSMSLPITRHGHADGPGGVLPVTHWVRGLLPEGNLLNHVAAKHRVPVSDSLALLHAVGPECAGAVQFLPTDAAVATPYVRELTRDELNALIQSVPTYDLPDGMGIQASLAGLQDKVLLTRLGDNRWGVPQNGAVSTHIVKPEPLSGVVAHLLDGENWSLSLAAQSGLSAAESHLETFGSRRALVIRRYDRTSDGRRIHQEDFCQALGLDPNAKYEIRQSKRPSRLAQIAALADTSAVSPTTFKTALLQQLTFNVLTGNADTHSKNHSLLIGAHGEVSLAPLYDSAPVKFLNPGFGGLGQLISGKSRLDSVHIDDLISEARTWGLDETTARRTVLDTADRLRSSLSENPVPAELAEVQEPMSEFWTSKGLTPPPLSGGVWVNPHSRNGNPVQGYWRRHPTR